MKTFLFLLILVISRITLFAQQPVTSGNFSISELNSLNFLIEEGKTSFATKFVSVTGKAQAGLLHIIQEQSSHYNVDAMYPALIASKDFSIIPFLFKENDYYFDSNLVKKRAKIVQEIKTAEKSCSRFTQLMKQDSDVILKYYLSKISAGAYYPVQIPIPNAEPLIAWYPSRFEFPYNLFHTINSRYVALFQKHYPGFGNEKSEKAAASGLAISIHPNPASDHIALQWDAVAPMSEINSIQATDLMGAKVSLAFTKTSESAYSVSVTSLHEGMFSMQILLKSGEMYTQSVQIIKQ